MQEQKLPAVEPGHTPAVIALPRAEGEGVKDAPGDPDYPKYIDHPVHGSFLVKSAEHEAFSLGQTGPSIVDAEIAEVSKLIGRNLTAEEKAFIAEIEQCMEKEDMAEVSGAAGKFVPHVPAMTHVDEIDEEPDTVVYQSPPVVVDHDAALQDSAQIGPVPVAETATGSDGNQYPVTAQNIPG